MTLLSLRKEMLQLLEHKEAEGEERRKGYVMHETADVRFVYFNSRSQNINIEHDRNNFNSSIQLVVGMFIHSVVCFYQ